MYLVLYIFAKQANYPLDSTTRYMLQLNLDY